MALTRDAILAADDRQLELVPVPEWGGEVYVRSLTSEEVRPITDNDNEMPVGLLVSIAACDEDGAPLFTEADIPALERKSVKALKRVVNAAMEINGLGENAAEDILGNSASGPESASSTS